MRQACEVRGGEEEVVIIYSWILEKISQICLKCPEKNPQTAEFAQKNSAQNLKEQLAEIWRSADVALQRANLRAKTTHSRVTQFQANKV